MPSKTKKQAKFMAAVANNPKFARKAGVPQSVGREFANADKRNKDMPSKYNSTANKPGKAVKKGYARGGMAHDKRVLRILMMRCTALLLKSVWVVLKAGMLGMKGGALIVRKLMKNVIWLKAVKLRVMMRVRMNLLVRVIKQKDNRI